MTAYPQFDLGFLRRVYIASGVSGTLIALMLFVYDPMGAYSFFAGLVFGIANLWGWSRFIQAVIKVGKIEPRDAVLTFFIKFPIILVLFFVILLYGRVAPAWYVAGFSYTFLIIVLKILAIILLSPKAKSSGGALPPDGSDGDGISI